MKGLSKSFYYPWSREIEYFIACSEAESFVQASERAGVQQPALTKSIRGLEFQLGTQLFHRLPTGIRLTYYGEVFKSALLKTKDFWESEIGQGDLAISGYRGLFRMGCHASIANSTFPKFLPQLVEQHPQIKVETVFDTSLNVTRMVAELKLDAGLVVNPVKNANLVMRPIHSEYVALWKSRPEFTETLLYNPDMYLGEKILKKFAGFRHIPMNDYEVIGKTIATSKFVGFLPDGIAERYNLKRVGEKVLNVKLSLIYRKDQSKNPAVADAIKLIYDRLHED